MVDGTPKIGDMVVPFADEVEHGLRELSDANISIGVRPEHLSFGHEGIRGEVVVVEELGSESFVHVHIDHQGETKTLVVRGEGETTIQRGDNVNVHVTGKTHAFAADGSRV